MTFPGENITQFLTIDLGPKQPGIIYTPENKWIWKWPFGNCFPKIYFWVPAVHFRGCKYHLMSMPSKHGLNADFQVGAWSNSDFWAVEDCTTTSTAKLSLELAASVRLGNARVTIFARCFWLSFLAKPSSDGNWRRLQAHCQDLFLGRKAKRHSCHHSSSH